jgi:curved DNA-binding protein CbpA
MDIWYQLVLIALSITLILQLRTSWKLWGKKEVKRKKVIEEPVRKGPLEEKSLVTEFMVPQGSPKEAEMEVDRESITKVYEPGGSKGSESMNVEYIRSEDSDHLFGHEVKIKEIPEAVREAEIDTSWIDFDMKRDHSKIFDELERKGMNCYEILGVEETASKDEVKKAYRNLASKYHPDKGEVLEGSLIDKIREINFSKEILLDPTMRALHDERLRQGEMSSEDREVNVDRRFDPGMLEMSTERNVKIREDVKMSHFVESVDGNSGLGVLFFRKWKEDLEEFGEDLMDYIIQLDEQGFIDYGEVMRGDVDDIEDVTKLRKISNFPMAVNNSLLEVWQRPPFYYLAVPINKKEHVQEICDILKETFGLESIFFSYPRI